MKMRAVRAFGWQGHTLVAGTEFDAPADRVDGLVLNGQAEIVPALPPVVAPPAAPQPKKEIKK